MLLYFFIENYSKKHCFTAVITPRFSILGNILKDIINTYTCLLKNANFSVKTAND